MLDNKRAKVLIVEDEVLIADHLQVILLDLGFEVSGMAFNEESAIKSLKSNPPDIAILDIKMHGSDQGFYIAQYIKDHLDIPFIFLTSHADEATLNEASKLKPEGYLLKPFNEADIFSTLNVVLKRYVKKEIQLKFRIGHDDHKVRLDDLLWIKSSDKYIEIQTTQKCYIKRDGIESFMADNELPGIIRVHRSFAVKLNKIDRVSGNLLYIDDQEIPISKTYASAFKRAYQLL